MATVNKTYVFQEGTTETGLYGRVELRLTMEPYIDAFSGESYNRSRVTADLYLVGKDYNSASSVDYTRTRLALYTAGGIFSIKHVRDNITYLLGDYDSKTGDTSDMRSITTNFSERSTLADTGQTFNEEYRLWVYPAEDGDEPEEYELHFHSSTFITYHNLDGTCRLNFSMPTMSIYDYSNEDASIDLTVDTTTMNIDLPVWDDRTVTPVTANNFTDEENPTFTYAALTNYSIAFYVNSDGKLVAPQPADTITALQAALSFDGVTPDIPYRDIPTGNNTYTFELTEEEREILRQKAQGSVTVPIYYITRVVRDVYYLREYTLDDDTIYHEEKEFLAKTKRNLTIVGCNPSIYPTVKDISPETLALTGDENTVVKYESMVEYAVNATASKHAEIVSQSVQCGNKIVEGLPYGVIDDVESELFIFKATDSRNLSAEATVQKNIIDYVKPTCYQKVAMEMAGEFDTRVALKITGNYFNGSFGAVDNELILQVRHTQNDGSMGDWVTLTDGLIPVFNGNTYTLETTISGFSYSQAYVFQCRATDKLNTAQSSQYTVRIYPVFDWGENDFNFNVPVNMSGEEGLLMNGETVLRHNPAANNTVVSGSGGHVYIRPGGTDDTSGETIFYPDGSVKFGGALTGTIADYVIETGTEAMGTNGTWYWQKWASGKAECYGTRNYGNMSITTSWNGGYRSNFFTQDFPTGLFNETPNFVDIRISKFGDNPPGMVMMVSTEGEVSTSDSGAFTVWSPVDTTSKQVHFGFNVIGRWQ